MWDFLKFKNNIAVITENNEKITYHQLDEYCRRFSSHIDKRCLILNVCANQLGALVGYVAALNTGVVPLMLSCDIEINLLNNIIELYRPAYINAPNFLAEKFNGYEKVYDNFGYSLIKTNFKDSYKLHENLALLLTTSGSTGSPKLVRQSYDNIVSNTKSIVDYLGLDSSECAITMLPMNYTYGLSVINTHLRVGATLILTEKSLFQKEFWTQFREHKATSLVGVPYTYEILDKLRFYRMDLPSLRYLTQAGGKLSPALHYKFAKWACDNNKKFIVMYGQTEATARMSYLPSEVSVEKFGSVGIAIPGGRFYLIDENGDVIDLPEVVGELVYEGKNVTLGYAQIGDDLIKPDEFNGVLYTGDMAKFDKDGYFYIVGRKKRFLKLFGNRVNLDETETLIKSNFKSLECACVGIDDLMKIFITDPNEIDNVLSFVTSITGINKVAFSIIFIDNIPKNEAGKILYKDLA